MMASNWPRPRTVNVRRTAGGFGFTLRHFIIYPPESAYQSLGRRKGYNGDARNGAKRRKRSEKLSDLEPVDTMFVKQVKEDGPADIAGLKTGDRILSVNNETVTGRTYSQVIDLIQSCQTDLTLLVVSKDVDILQMAYPKSAYNQAQDAYAGSATDIPSPPSLCTPHLSSASQFPPSVPRTSLFPQEAAVPRASEEPAAPQPARYKTEVSLPVPASPSANHKEPISLSPPKTRHKVRPALYSLGPAPYQHQASKIRQSSFFHTKDGRRYPPTDDDDDRESSSGVSGYSDSPLLRSQSSHVSPSLGFSTSSTQLSDRRAFSTSKLVPPPLRQESEFYPVPTDHVPPVNMFKPVDPPRHSAFRSVQDQSDLVTSAAKKDTVSQPPFANVNTTISQPSRVGTPPKRTAMGSEGIRRSQERLKQLSESTEGIDNMKIKVPSARDVAGAYLKQAVENIYGKNSVEAHRAQGALHLATSNDPELQRRHQQRYGRSATAPLFGSSKIAERPKPRTASVPVAPITTAPKPQELYQPGIVQTALPISQSNYPASFQSKEFVTSAEPLHDSPSVTSIVSDPAISRTTGLSTKKLATNSASLDSIHSSSGLKPLPSYEELVNTEQLSRSQLCASNFDDTKYKSDTYLSVPSDNKRLSYTASLSKIHENIVAQSQETKPSRTICAPWVQNGVQSGRSAIQAAKRAFLLNAGLLDAENLQEKDVTLQPGLAPKSETGALQLSRSPSIARRQFLGLPVTDEDLKNSSRFPSSVNVTKQSFQPFDKRKSVEAPSALITTSESKSKDRVKPPLKKQLTTPEFRTPISRSAFQLDVTPLPTDEERIAALKLVQQRHHLFEHGDLDVSGPDKLGKHKEDAEKAAALSMHNVALRAAKFGLQLSDLEKLEQTKELRRLQEIQAAKNRRSSLEVPHCTTILPHVPPSADSTSSISTAETTTSTLGGVTLRPKTHHEDEDAKGMRRSSYIMATHSAEDLRAKVPSPKNASIRKLKAFFGDKTSPSHDTTDRPLSRDSRDLPSPMFDVIKEGYLHLKKHIAADGKRASDRSWKPYYVVLRGHVIYMYKDKRESALPPLSYDEPPISIKSSIVDIAHDYTKRKNVFRLCTYNGSEYLFQAEDIPSMMTWIQAIQSNNNPDEDDKGVDTAQLIIRKSSLYDSQSRSPQPGQKSRRMPFRHKSIGIGSYSPSFKDKSRKGSSSTERDISPKLPKPTKSWSRKMVKGLKKWGHHGPPRSPTQTEITGGTIGVPLECCPPSAHNEFLPLLVDICTSIVKTVGMEVIGVYRIPGNTAAVAYLTEEVNKGVENINLDDHRWKEINVVTSLLKSFFRKLPESLVTNELYGSFIQVNKTVHDPSNRLLQLKKLIQALPDHNYYTLKHMISHLKLVSDNQVKNKMDVRNIAIVFGPTLLRQPAENLTALVSEMGDQCRIVETMINHSDWLFCDDDDDIANDNVPPAAASPDENLSPTQPYSQEANINLLLKNVSKTEQAMQSSEQDSKITKDIVSSIISAASRKMGKKKERPTYVSDESDMSEFTFSERNIDEEITLRSSAGREATRQKQRRVLDSQSSTDTGLSSWTSPVLSPTSPPSRVSDSKHSTRQSSVVSSSSGDSRFTIQKRDSSQSSDIKSPDSSDADSRSHYAVKWPSPFQRNFTTYHNNKHVSPRKTVSEVPSMSEAFSRSQEMKERQKQERQKREVDRHRIEREWQRLKEDLEKDEDDKDPFSTRKYDTLNTNSNSNVFAKKNSFESNSSTGSSSKLDASEAKNPILTSDYNSLSSTGSTKSVPLYEEKITERGIHLQHRPVQKSASHNAVDKWEQIHNECLVREISCDSVHDRLTSQSSNSSLSDDGRELLKNANFDQKLKILLDPHYRLGDKLIRNLNAIPQKTVKTPQVSRKTGREKRRHTVCGTSEVDKLNS